MISYFNQPDALHRSILGNKTKTALQPAVEVPLVSNGLIDYLPYIGIGQIKFELIHQFLRNLGLYF